MPWTSIGTLSSDTLTDDPEWQHVCYDMALVYLRYACGFPPPGCIFGVYWHGEEGHESPALGVYSGHEPPWDHIDRCEDALDRFDETMNWLGLRPGVDLVEDAATGLTSPI